jgi:cytochrome c-type biogenesis protein CcmH/NrfG
MRTFCLAAFILACALLSLVHASSDTKKLQEAQKMRASGNIAGAIGVLRTMSAKQPDNTRVLALLGDSLMESGDATEAHAMYRWPYCDYAADFDVSRQIQRMLEVTGG